MRLGWYRRLPRLTFFARRLCGANYEREMALLDVLCDPAATGIDVGAKVGMYTYRIRDRSRDVLAFEPNPVFHRFLTRALGCRRVRVEPYAVSREAGSATLRLPFDRDDRPQFGRSTIDPANALAHCQIARTDELCVETRTLDCYALPAVGFLKIDVEGHELAVLEGAERMIAAHHPNLLIESNDDHQPEGRAKLIAWLTARDYTPVFLAGREILDIEHYCRVAHWEQQHIENVIGIHRSRSDLRPRLERRARAARHWYATS